MPAISAPSKVLVTGANGFIAVWILRYLLESGYSVRGTIRSSGKGEYLLKHFASFVQQNQLELVVVGDLLTAGAFDDAVKGVDAIIHTASPVTFHADDPNELIIPAVSGTVSVLESAVRYAPTVKRVVVLSSIAAIVNGSTDTGLLDESRWNTESVDAVNEKGRNANQSDKYRASKVLAERAAWDFVEKNKDKVKWDLTTTNPTFVYGPMLHEVSSLSELNATSQQFYSGALADSLSPPPGSELAKINLAWVDVRDVALAHVRAIEVDEAGGKRFILCNYATNWEDWRNIVKGLPAQPIDPESPPTTTNVNESGTYTYDHSRAEKVLGIQFRDRESTAKDIINDLKERGWY